MKKIKYKFKVKLPDYKRDPLWYFKLAQKDETKLWLRVYVWKTQQEMDLVHKKQFPHSFNKIAKAKQKIGAWCHVETGNRTNWLGDVHFNAKNATLEYVSHETAHLILEHCRNMNYNTFGKDQEMLARHSGRIAEGIGKFLKEKRLLKI